MQCPQGFVGSIRAVVEADAADGAAGADGFAEADDDEDDVDGGGAMLGP